MIGPECVDCIAAGVTRWRRIVSGNTKRSWRCATHTRAVRTAKRAGGRVRRLAVRFSMTPLEYERIKAMQGGTCGICGPWSGRNGGTKALAVDHDHKCDRGHEVELGCEACWRGLLCSDCNRLLGRIGDNPDVLRRALTYLAHPPARDSEGWLAATKPDRVAKLSHCRTCGYTHTHGYVYCDGLRV